MRLESKVSKKGTFYVPLITFLTFIFIIVAYILLVQYFEEGGRDPASKSIGEKQGALLDAVQEGERIRVYSESALSVARIKTLQRFACGVDFLSGKLVSADPQAQSCQQAFITELEKNFNEELSKYPKGTIGKMFSSPVIENDELVFKGKIAIPIAGADLPIDASATGGHLTSAGGTFSGNIGVWPVEIQDTTITSYFGWRDLEASCGKYHAGLDMRGAEGDVVDTLFDGIAQYHPGGGSYVSVDSGDLIIEYIHVKPAPALASGRPVQVTKGMQIATIGKLSGSEHLHIEIMYKGLSNDAARNYWPNNVVQCSDKSQNRISETYAILNGGNYANLDPICFFDKTFIESVNVKPGVTDKADRFEACHAYQQKLGLSQRLGIIGNTAQQPNIPTTNTPDPNNSTEPSPTLAVKDPATSSVPEVQMTYQRLNDMGVYDLVQETAKQHSIDPAVFYGIITQESKGDPNARSPTGPVGLGQFEYNTALDYFPSKDRLHKCNEAPGCNPSNDDRFNPSITIEAMGKKIGNANKKYDSYDQKTVFILIDYNAGTGAAEYIRRNVGSSNPSWPEIKSVIQNAPAGNNVGLNPDKKIELVKYIEIITGRWIPEWGGATLSGSSYTSEKIGSYTLRLAFSIKSTSTAADVIDELKRALAICQDDSCVDQTIANTASQYGVSIEKENLDSDTGCWPAETRALEYLTTQLEYCKRNQDDNCLCEFNAGINARFEISTSYSKLIELNGKEVTGVQGAGMELGGVGDAGTNKVKLYDGARVSEEDLEFTIKLEKPNSAKIEHFFIDDSFTSLQKKNSDGALSFSTSDITPENQCVNTERDKAQAYCIKIADNSFPPLVVYVDRKLLTSPQADSAQYRSARAPLSSSIRVQFFSDNRYPFIKITYTKLGEGTREQYYRVVDTNKGLFVLLGDSFVSDIFSAISGRERTAEHTELPTSPISMAPLPPHETKIHLYDLLAKPESGETATLTLLDENWREAETFDIDFDLQKENSGIVLPDSLLSILGVPAPISG